MRPPLSHFGAILASTRAIAMQSIISKQTQKSGGRVTFFIQDKSTLTHIYVPADLITKMLMEKPQIKGLSVPGMPMGSPGMEGPRKDDYDIVTFSEDGKTSVYASR
ncbi:MAG: DUF411 domain-containing protein [Sedimenticola sp.]